jgi:hypothetical protein
MVDELAGLIDEYINGSRSRSLCKLARDSGVAYTTLRRIVQKDVGAVGMETTVALLRVFQKSSEILAFVEKHYPESGKMFAEFAAKLNSDQFAPKDLTDILKDYHEWLFSVLAERTEGVAPDDVEYYLGVERAKKTIREYEELDLVDMINGKYHLRDKDYILSGAHKTQLAIIKHICDSYDVTKKSLPGHMLVNLTKQWNDEGLAFVRETLREAAIKINEASNDKKYAGDKTCFFGIVSATLD